MATGSFNTISIYRAIPVIAGYLQMPNNKEKNKTKVHRNDTFIWSPPLKYVTLGASGAHVTAGGRHGHQQYVELYGIPIDSTEGLGPDYEQFKTYYGTL